MVVVAIATLSRADDEEEQWRHYWCCMRLRLDFASGREVQPTGPAGNSCRCREVADDMYTCKDVLIKRAVLHETREVRLYMQCMQVVGASISANGYLRTPLALRQGDTLSCCNISIRTNSLEQDVETEKQSASGLIPGHG